jgi:hypothetical protein
MLLVLAIAVVLESIWLPVNVTEFTGNETHHYNDHAYVWTLLRARSTFDVSDPDFKVEYSPEPYRVINVTRYAARTTLTLALVLLVCLVLRRYRHALEENLCLAPLCIYACVALIRLLYVPCTWNHYAHNRQYFRTYSGTLPVWAIGTEQIRYRLLFFHEFVLLVLLVALYAGVFTAVPTVRFRFLERMGRKRFVD